MLPGCVGSIALVIVRCPSFQTKFRGHGRTIRRERILVWQAQRLARETSPLCAARG